MSFQYAKKQSKSSNSKISQRSIKSNFVIQPKLKVNQPGDIYEQEADKIAEQVMNIPVSRVQRKCSNCQMNDDDELKIHRKSDNMGGLELSDDIANDISSIRDGGSSLDGSTRDFMESRFGFDFGNVRIHTDERASRSAESVNALAYTVENDIVFGSGNYSPRTESGAHLLAHELTHVIQSENLLNKKVLRQDDDGGLPPGGADSNQVSNEKGSDNVRFIEETERKEKSDDM